MKRLAYFLIRLYPREWRARYGDEFTALIEDSPLRVATIFDLCGGAIGMQFNRRTFSRTAAVLSILGLAAGFAASWLVKPVYTSRALLTIHSLGEQSESASLRLMAMQQDVLSRTSLSRIIQDPRLDLYHAERLNTPLEDVIETMRTRDILIRPVPWPGTDRAATAFTISFSYPDARKAQRVTQALIVRFQQINEQQQTSVVKPEMERLEQRVSALEQRLGMTSEPPDPYGPRGVSVSQELTILNPPSFPIAAESPNRPLFAACGFGAGFVLSILVVLLRRPLLLPPAQTA